MMMQTALRMRPKKTSPLLFFLFYFYLLTSTVGRQAGPLPQANRRLCVDESQWSEPESNQD